MGKERHAELHEEAGTHVAEVGGTEPLVLNDKVGRVQTCQVERLGGSVHGDVGTAGGGGDGGERRELAVEHPIAPAPE